MGLSEIGRALEEEPIFSLWQGGKSNKGTDLSIEKRRMMDCFGQLLLQAFLSIGGAF